MVKEIVQHGHCHACGRAVKYGDITCSDACKQVWDRKKRSQKTMLWMMIAALVLLVGLPLLQNVLRGV